jgi:hypothetical protein
MCPTLCYVKSDDRRMKISLEMNSQGDLLLTTYDGREENVTSFSRTEVEQVKKLITVMTDWTEYVKNF